MPPDATSPDQPVLAAAGLTKHFTLSSARGHRRIVHAVDEVDLALHRGKVVALVGESGSGKSTVARLLARLHRQSSGQVLLGGEEVNATSGRRFRAYCHRVQMILQDPFASLNPVHTIGYTLRRSLRIHRPRLTKTQLEEEVTGLLSKVSLNPAQRYIDKLPHELSGGQRQRVAIARALGAQPVVLLADEPVSMLDVSIRLGVLNLLAELKDEFNLAILYITHDIASARYFADETVVMYAGRVVERGPSEDVTQHPAHPYTKLLISSAPNPDAAEHHSHNRGEPPSLTSPPSGCRFHPRCQQAMDRCRSQVPIPLPVGDNRSAACWLYDTSQPTEEP